MIPHIGKSGLLALALAATRLAAGPYSLALDDPLSPTDAPVPGFIGPHGIGKARIVTGFDENDEPIYENPENHINPLFFAWAESVTLYDRSDGDSSFSDAGLALGPVTGDAFDVVSLGELDSGAIAAGSPPGTITLELAKPVLNLSGADFVVFENGAIAEYNFGGAGIGGIFAELAYVEVSADGVNFVPFPNTSLTPAAVGGYGSIDATNVRNLAGKHVNAYGDSWGTPFDLSEVGLARITHVRLVDIPGNGSRLDSSGNPIRDPWTTFGSGGCDLEAVGAVSTAMTFAEWPQLAGLSTADSAADADPDGDGSSNLLEYAFGTLPWKPDTIPNGLMIDNGHAELRFVRDERLQDLVYEVQVASALDSGNWTTIARSAAGAPVVGVGGHLPVIVETSAGTIRSIGVIRMVTVRDIQPATTGGRRFMRVKVTSNIIP